ncbi:hypothetical protein [Psychrobacillus sp. FSL K6-2843]|uniref:hypothetical protein n=1 Tax=Psychrobacillus sp. FSL K6-2843 TaxID=2921549 RepID=UPI00315A31F9
MSNKIKQEMSKIEIPKEISERSKLGISKVKSERGKHKFKRSFIIAPAIVASLAIGIFTSSYFTNDSVPENPIIKTMEYSSSFDLSDTPRLIGWADNVFIGKVIKQSGTKSLGGIPETQFEVEVTDNIKGDLEETIIVNQQGGYTKEELILVENDPLLKEGQLYLFVTKYLQEENWYTLVPVYGDILINNNDEKNNLIQEYKIEYENEIPFGN